MNNLPALVGNDLRVRYPDGTTGRAISMNHAATTPVLQTVLDAVNDLMTVYGAFHRGAGPRAKATTQRVDAAIAAIRQFVDAPDDTTCVFTANTSAALNLLARLVPLTADDVVLTSDIEHTSNSLPWHHQTAAQVVEARSDATGRLDMDHVATLVAQHGRALKLVTLTGASNQTGSVPDVAVLRTLLRNSSAYLVIDAAQLAPHRPIAMQRQGIDILALSAHKLYAPFGLGLLVLPTHLLHRVPVDPGGGSIDMIRDPDHLVWAPPAARHQTGTYNVPGIVALGAACRTLADTGWDTIIAHEHQCLDPVLHELAAIAGVRLFVPPALYQQEQRIATVPFAVRGMHHALVAAVLDAEYGIEVRAGTICNHRLVRRWHAIDDDMQQAIEQAISAGDRLASYGVVRASLGLGSTPTDGAALGSALRSLIAHGPQLVYQPDPANETFVWQG